MSICSLVSPVVTALQSVVDSFLSVFSFLNLPAFDLASLINPILGCTS